MVNQCGGGYGGKVIMPAIPACAAAVGASVLNRPVRVSFDLSHSLEILGKRNPFYAKYKVGFDKNGVILGVIIDWMEDQGCSPNQIFTQEGYNYIDNVYNIKNWHIATKVLFLKNLLIE